MTERGNHAWPTPMQEIRADFGYDASADERVATYWAAAVQDWGAGREALDRARAVTLGRTAYVLGAGPEAQAALDRVPGGACLWVADGAVVAARDASRLPHVIVTDLDGHPQQCFVAARQGSVAFIHAHGDNEGLLREHGPKFPPRLVAGTCQVAPIAPLLNPGGFTDGDRAVALALVLGAARVRLVGWDWETPGPYSRRSDVQRKRRKLDWARRLIDSWTRAGAPVEVS